MKNLTESITWQTLASSRAKWQTQAISDLFASNPSRFVEFSIKSSGLLLDYSRQPIDDSLKKIFTDIGQSLLVHEKIRAQCMGETLNFTENRAALHTALRHTKADALSHLSKNIVAEQTKCFELANAIHEHRFVGTNGQAFTDVVNIGIGGSHLGPLMATTALQTQAVSPLRFHFLSSIDKGPINTLIHAINPETTLFIVSSKSFTTLETLTNANTLKEWLQSTGHQAVIDHQWFAITAQPEKAQAFGFSPEHILKTWEWVGGRYSLWSAVGLPLLLKIGKTKFLEFLKGAASIDEHAQTAPYENNMPFMLAMLSYLHMSFNHVQAEAIAPYSQRLQFLIPYLQQATMESLGKSVNIEGETVPSFTGPIIFGQEGCEGQHAYHQLLHQGNLTIPVDFILIGKAEKNESGLHHDALLASALSQAEALTRGLSLTEVLAQHPELSKASAAHRVLPGNRPCNILLLDELTPATLGALIALYEHKIFILSVLWEINAFDQWGVELGKKLLPDILKALQTPLSGNEPPTLLTYLKQLKQGSLR